MQTGHKGEETISGAVCCFGHTFVRRFWAEMPASEVLSGGGEAIMMVIVIQKCA